MATDITAISSNLASFYDMREKSVIHVGAGGGQLIRYAGDARSVLAVDPDPAAVTRLKTAIRHEGLLGRFSIVQADFSSIHAQADVVFFEFCLHEMDDPEEALVHARSSSPDLVVLDHLPDSPWAWCTCEEEKAARSWAAARRHRVVREASFKATQHFKSHSELLERIEVLGEQAVERIERFSGQEDIRIAMTYAMALIQGHAA